MNDSHFIFFITREHDYIVLVIQSDTFVMCYHDTTAIFETVRDAAKVKIAKGFDNERLTNWWSQNSRSFVHWARKLDGFLFLPGILVIIDRKSLKRMKVIESCTLYYSVA